MLFFLSWALFVSAIARPVWVGEPLQITPSGRDLFIALDLSGSMQAADMEYNGKLLRRVDVVKSVVADFVEQRHGDRLGLILFGDNAYLQAPLTFDRNTVKQLLEETFLGMAGNENVQGEEQKKLDVTCSVAIHNLFLTDDVLNEFDTRYKVNPPLRTQDDIDALIEGVKDGTIDMVTSDHNPQTIEEKKVEFDHANYGTIGLESAFGALNQIFSTKKSIQLLTKGKERFGTITSKIEEGEVANITLFNPNEKYVFGKSNILSKSKNSAFIGQELKGKVYGIYANKKIVL